MLILSKKNKGINIIDCWYAEQALKQNGVIRYTEALKPLGEHPTEFVTLVSDLTEDEEAILSHFSKNCRYEVRRAPREGVECSFRIGKQISAEEILAFTDFFEEFWKSKGMNYGEKEKNRSLIRQYAQAGAFAITTASIGGKVLIYHTYIVEDSRVRLYQSASWFRVDDSVSANVVGFANRCLHYQDMLWFKKLGKTQYDWGGAGTEEEVESITRFKESFGGTHVTYYNGEETRGVLSGLYKRAAGMIGRITERKHG